MKASEARKLTDKNQITFEKAIDDIKLQANNGGCEFHFWNLGHEVMTKLINLGYKISLHVDPISGSKSHKCEW